MSVWLSPASSRARASWRWWGVSLGGRPKRTPRSLARTIPSPQRERISSRSNSASPPRTVMIRRPWAFVVSAQASLRLRKLAPRSLMVLSRLSRSRVERASRSSRVTSARRRVQAC